MRVWIGIAVLLVISLASGAPAPAQLPAAPQNPTIASTLDFQLTIVEMEFVSAAEAMPDPPANDVLVNSPYSVGPRALGAGRGGGASRP